MSRKDSQWKEGICVSVVGKPSLIPVTFKDMKELTLERNLK
jgi:hypothetical protein